MIKALGANDFSSFWKCELLKGRTMTYFTVEVPDSNKNLHLSVKSRDKKTPV